MLAIVADIHAALIGAASISNIQSQGVDQNIVRVPQGGSGTAERYGTGVLGLAPVSRFSTYMVNTLLGATGVTGLKIDTTTKLTLWLKLFDDGAIRQAGATHTKCEIDDGLIYPVSLQAAQGAYAAIDVACAVCERTGDGTHPIVWTASQALTGTVEAAEHYTLGATTINAVVPEGVQSVSVDFGLQIGTTGGSGRIYPDGVYVARVLPTVQIVCQDSALVSSIAESGLAISSTAVIQLAAVAQNAVAPSATGISLTVNGGISYRESYAGENCAPGSFVVTIVPTKEGANELLALGSY